ncbi:Plant self-incompatibility S1 [Dillenia turbinata]|uniref:S-protein homolog n=1 Tax=Dillenia turbinata TaxID=194707 RepID=A0AAN8VK14_9MAGN
MSPIKTTPCLLILLVLSAAIQSEARWGKTRVEIHNTIGPGVDLTVHCKSKDDDIGEQLLHFNDSFGFNFRPRFFFGGTLFFCSFKWGSEFKYFDVYDEDRDSDICHYCVWNIVPSGPCLLKEDSADDYHCFEWNKSENQKFGSLPANPN